MSVREVLPADNERTFCGVTETPECPSCSKPVPRTVRRGYPKVYCSDSCRAKGYREHHPRLDQIVQKRDRTQCDLILERLREGPATRLDLFKASGSLNTTGRVSELRKRGYVIDSVRIPECEHPQFVLISEPER